MSDAEEATNDEAVLRDGALVAARNVTCRYTVDHRPFDAVVDVSFDVMRGETLALVGESGCGKSTVCRAILQLPRPHKGNIAFQGNELTALNERQLRPIRKHMQIVFQDPQSSLNPRKTANTIVRKAATLYYPDRATSQEKAYATLRSVGIDPETTGGLYPRHLSGGQAQRVALARALVVDPEVLVCDEVVSALDVSVQAEILALLERLKSERGLSMIFISHDLAVVRQIASRVAVMYLGRICEIGNSEQIFSSPMHHYTNGLLDAVPHPDPGRPFTGVALAGEIPSPTDPPSGCRFRTRCPRAEARCATEEPLLRRVEADHFIACHFPIELSAPRRASLAREGSQP